MALPWHRGVSRAFSELSESGGFLDVSRSQISEGVSAFLRALLGELLFLQKMVWIRHLIQELLKKKSEHFIDCLPWTHSLETPRPAGMSSL